MGSRVLHLFLLVGTVLLGVGLIRSSPVAAELILREAEAADAISAPLQVYESPAALAATASGGRYIGTDEGSGDQNSNPPAAGVATYKFTAKGGVYKILLRVSISGGSNSFWVRVVGATKYAPGTHGSGWIRFNDIADGAAWHWDEVHSNDHNNQLVQITLPAGDHTLEIARREDGALLDAWAITDNLALNEATLPESIGPKAFSPNPANGTIGVTAPLFQWKPGNSAIFHDVYLGTDPNPPLVAPKQMFAMYYHIAGLVPGTTYYWRVDEVEADGVTIHKGDVWTFSSEPLKNYLPAPADAAASVLPGLILNWKPGKDAAQYQVYFGTDQAAVSSGAASADKGKVTDLKFDSGALRASTTYYWRVDVIKADQSVVQGDVWSFSTADAGPANKIKYETWTGIGGTAVNNLTSNAAYPSNPSSSSYVDSFQSPVDWADNYGQRLWGWLKPEQSGDYTFWIAGDDEQQLWLSTDGSPTNAKMIANVSGWTPALDFDNTGGGVGGASQKSAAIKLEGGKKYFIMALGKEGGGGDSTAVAWQGPGIAARAVIAGKYVDMFNLPPLQAFGPDPANGAVDTAQAMVLSWTAGEKAQKHEVYFGEDKAAVAAADNKSPLFKGQQAGTTYNANDLEWGKTYYWRVDEINAGEAESPWKGAVWSFTTATFIPIDNFESYNDDVDAKTTIFDTWIDGVTDGKSGSTVGNFQAPFAEQRIVHAGKQAMPMDYNNTKTPFFSEATLEFAPLENWTVNGVTDLSLWFRGQPGAFLDKGNNAFTVSGGGTDIWNNDDQFRFAYKSLSGDGSITAKVDSLTRSDAWSKAGVMIRETLDGGSKHAMIVVTPDNSVSFQYRNATSGSSANNDQAGGLKAPYWVRLTRTGNVFKGESSPDGKTWTQVGQTTITMTANVSIGLSVTAHNAAAISTAEFSNVASTGTGVWKAAAIGSAQAANSPGSLYVRVEDSAGKSATATNPDPGAVNVTTWTEWKIPLSSLTGVNLAKVKRLSIGVGDRNSPAKGGAGRMYIDDVRVTKP